MNLLPGAWVTRIDPGPTAAYSGMLPGYVAGHCSREELDIDLARLAQFAGARCILGRAHDIDTSRKIVSITGAPDVSYDFLSVDIGINGAITNGSRSSKRMSSSGKPRRGVA
jgi:selenide,water dikinase